MSDPLSPEQIELLRGLPVPCLDVRDVSQAESFAQMHKCGLVYAPPILPYNGEHEWRRLESADTLLATLDHQRDQIIGEIEGLAERYEGQAASYEEQAKKAITQARSWESYGRARGIGNAVTDLRDLLKETNKGGSHD